VGTVGYVKLVPIYYVDLVLGDDWRQREDLAGLARAGVKVASRVEVDLEAGPADVAEQVLNYVDRCRTLARELERGAIGPWVVVSLPLITHIQQAGSKSAKRGDLSDVYAELSNHEETRAILENALGATLDIGGVTLSGGVVTALEGNASRVEVRVEGPRDWPEILGGAAGPNEIERLFRFYVNHAPWRDRQVRRLTRVEIFSIEMLSDPRVATS
jgi:hypothetical protein